ncbi:MAG: NAD(P)H-dependent oxidoreductase [Ruminococcus sp.]|uniref:NAD(P)H-dependent oxidoreductase n=1 Tax=Ruminococcus sp. TaxID=41978 RepID=UPI002873A16B|nr:NAD(P)H-dependent oxidoreductase [Ruminococcus sp.]MBQ3285672.1 NAD(P)H-dependent oxidoreductase [Ruminococcus sp.]
MILFVNACVRTDSRTKLLADYLLSKLNGEITEHRLSEISLPEVDEDYLIQRVDLIEDGQTDHPLFRLAREFAAADTIVIASPYWDLSFTAALKRYIEQITVTGVTFRYTPEGIPVGLCRAKRLYYITTAGGTYVPTEYGYGYIKALSEGFYGIRDVRLVLAAGLDIDGADEEEIMKKAFRDIDSIII